MLLRSGIRKTHRDPISRRAASQIALRAIADEAPRVGEPVSLEAFDDKLQATWRSAEVSGACRALTMQLALGDKYFELGALEPGLNVITDTCNGLRGRALLTEKRTHEQLRAAYVR